MKKSMAMIMAGFESSCSATPEFLQFFRAFKSEFAKEVKAIGGTDLKLTRGHFSVSGFFTLNGRCVYINLGDVRGMDYGLHTNPDSCMNKLLFREARDRKDYTGGMNRYARIETGMGEEILKYFR